MVAELSKAERSALMKFATSVSRAPLGGFKHLIPPLTIHKVCSVPDLSAHMDTQTLTIKSSLKPWTLQHCVHKSHGATSLGKLYLGRRESGILFIVEAARGSAQTS